MKLKDLLENINTSNKIMLSASNGEEFFPSFAGLFRYQEHYIKFIQSYDKGLLLIGISEEE